MHHAAAASGVNYGTRSSSITIIPSSQTPQLSTDSISSIASNLVPRDDDNNYDKIGNSDAESQLSTCSGTTTTNNNINNRLKLISCRSSCSCLTKVFFASAAFVAIVYACEVGEKLLFKSKIVNFRT